MIDGETLRGAIQIRMQLLTSSEADFDNHTWTFTAPYFVVAAGEYLVIHRSEWEKLWESEKTKEQQSKGKP